MAFAMRMRLPKAMTPISLLRRLTSSSRRTSPVISCSVRVLALSLDTNTTVHTDELLADIVAEALAAQPVDNLVDRAFGGVALRLLRLVIY